MALEDYRGKRDFAATPEPVAEVKSSPGGNLFVIQKHLARRLHYDLQLELGGVLKSWAVPKGPSLDPADKRLAVQVEDHPLEYVDFEGVIPKGEYGGGTVMVWDQGTWHPDGETAVDPEASYRAGTFKFRLEGEKLRGGWMLVRLKSRKEERAVNWLLFKERDDEAREGRAADITGRAPRSAKTGRSMEEIAAEADCVSSGDGEQRGEQPQETVARLKAKRAQPAAGETHSQRPLAPQPHPDEIEGARPGPLPDRMEPEPATLVPAAPGGDDWLHEIKFDGYRVPCRIDDGARLMRALLEDLGLKAFVKATGGKGLHVVVPILPTLPWDEAKAFTKAIAGAVARADPQHYVSTMALKRRAGKIYIDYLRNGRGATCVAAYSTRRRPGAPVSTPSRWDEIGAAMRADRYTVRNLRRRLAALGDDPWRGFAELRQEITPDMRHAVGGRLDKRA